MRAGRKRKSFDWRSPVGRAERRSEMDPRIRIANSRIVAAQEGHKPSAIYVICPQSDGRPCKIGVSNDPKQRRVDELQVAHWMKLVVAEVIWVENSTVAHVIENESHYRLYRRGLSLSGEWFNVSTDEAKETISEVMTSFEVQAVDKSAELNYGKNAR